MLIIIIHVKFMCIYVSNSSYLGCAERVRGQFSEWKCNVHLSTIEYLKIIDSHGSCRASLALDPVLLGNIQLIQTIIATQNKGQWSKRIYNHNKVLNRRRRLFPYSTDNRSNNMNIQIRAFQRWSLCSTQTK